MLLLFCPAKKAHLSQHLAPGVPFSVNVLRADQMAVSTFFAGAWRAAPDLGAVTDEPEHIPYDTHS
jgi:hypothetical protein